MQVLRFKKFSTFLCEEVVEVWGAWYLVLYEEVVEV